MQAQKLISTVGMTREQWLEVRRKGIGGSDASAVLGVSKYKSALGCWLDKTGQAPPDDGEQSEAAFWGTTLEAVIAKVYADQHPDVKVRNVNYVLQHPDYEFMLANIDRVLIYPDGTKAILEIKTAGAWVAGEWKDDDVPVAYMAQAAHYMAVTGLDKVVFACLIAGQRLEIREFHRDKDLELSLIDKEKNFWAMVESGEMPAMDGSEDCADCLDFMFANRVDETVELEAEALAWIERLVSAKEAIKDGEAEKELCVNSLKALMGNSVFGLCGEYQLSWKELTSSRVDTKLLAAEYPEVDAAVRKESSSFRFECKKKKVEKPKKVKEAA